MGLYSKYFYPKIIDSLLSKPEIMKHRQAALSNSRGKILEIGFGTGLNLLCYPTSVKEITVIDTNAAMGVLAEEKMKDSDINVIFKLLSAEKLPFEDNTFDSVVSTFTFCSIDGIDSAITEMKRVLKPDGRLIFLEHGVSCEPKVSKWQNRVNPFYKIFSDGCNLNRDIKDIIQRNNFEFEHIEQFYCKDLFKLAGYFYKGVALKA